MPKLNFAINHDINHDINHEIQNLIAALELQPHPEGGYYARKHAGALQARDNAGIARHAYTSIHFLLTKDNPSNFHRLSADEIWYFHAGSPLTIHMLDQAGTYSKVELGLDVAAGQRLSFVVPAGVIFGSSVESGYALVSCAVVPGFDFADFKLFSRGELLDLYPEQAEIITQLTRK